MNNDAPGTVNTGVPCESGSLPPPGPKAAFADKLALQLFVERFLQ